MKTIIQGKHRITHNAISEESLCKTIKKDENGNDIIIFTGIPHAQYISAEDSEWETFCEIEEEVKFNVYNGSTNAMKFNNSTYDKYRIGHINLNEDELIGVIEKIFRLDLKAYVLHTNYLLSDKMVFENEEDENILNNTRKEFVEAMILSDDKLLAYCNENNLDIKNMEFIIFNQEIFKTVYPNAIYNIKDGKLNVIEF